MLLTNLTLKLPEMSLTQLVHIMYSTVKLRLPEDQLIGECVGLITDRLANNKEDLTLKELALLIWSSARIKLPRDSILVKF